MFAVAGVSFTHTGTFATSFTAIVTTEQSTLSLPTFEPMSMRSMCGQEKFSSNPSTPASWHAVVSACQLRSSLSLPEPAMIDAMRMRSGCAFLIFSRRGIHQSVVLSEISSQFHEATSVVFGRLFMERRTSLLSARRNFVFGPFTFTTGCRPIVFVTTPPQPASKARRMFESDSVGGAEARRNGFGKRIPVNVVDRSAMSASNFGKGGLYAAADDGERASGLGAGGGAGVP